MTFPKNPYHPDALNMDAVTQGRGEGLAFAVHKGGEVALKGVFEGGCEYTGEGWSQIPALVVEKGANNQTRMVLDELSPYDVGLVCSPSGRWPEDVFVLADEQHEA